MCLCWDPSHQHIWQGLVTGNRPQLPQAFLSAFSAFVFAFGGFVTILSYVGVTLVARSASTDKASAGKAGKTVILHMIQLVVILIATIYSSILVSFARIVDRTTLIRLYNSFYVCLNIFPRCLSALIYGLRDKSIRPVLLKKLCGNLKCLAPT